MTEGCGELQRRDRSANQVDVPTVESSAVGFLRGGSGMPVKEKHQRSTEFSFQACSQPRCDGPPVILMMDPNWLETEVAKNKVTVLVFFRGLVSLHGITMISHQLAACHLSSPLL